MHVGAAVGEDPVETWSDALRGVGPLVDHPEPLDLRKRAVIGAVSTRSSASGERSRSATIVTPKPQRLLVRVDSGEHLHVRLPPRAR